MAVTGLERLDDPVAERDRIAVAFLEGNHALLDGRIAAVHKLAVPRAPR